MPKPAQRVQEIRPRQAVFAASIKQHPKRLVMLTEGDSWFSYPLNANIADYLEMMSDFSLLRLEHSGDEAREILGAGSDQLRTALPVDTVHWADEIHPSGTGFRRLAEDRWRPLLKAQFPGRGFD